MSGPMDPDRLASLRAEDNTGSIEGYRVGANEDGPWFDALVTELLDSNDHHSKRADAAEKAHRELEADYRQAVEEGAKAEARADAAEAEARSWKSQADENWRSSVAAWDGGDP